MGYKRNIDHRAVCAAMLLGLAEPSPATPREPFIVTPLPEQSLTVTKLGVAEDEGSAADEAIANVSRLIGHARLADQQAIEAKSRTTRPAPDSVTDRFAWAVNCRYIRH